MRSLRLFVVAPTLPGVLALLVTVILLLTPAAAAGTAGGFTVVSGSPFDTGGLYARQLAIGDLNGDGKADLVVANYQSLNTLYGYGSLGVLLGNGSGGFTQAPGAPIIVPEDATSVAIQDFNRDGRPDLAVLMQGGSPDLEILLGDGQGSFTPAGQMNVGSSPSSMEIGDFNRDGYADIALADGPGLDVLLGDGYGGFTETAGSPVSLGGGGDHFAIGDLNSDGTPDIAAITSSHVAVLLGDGSGGFTPVTGSPFATGDTNSLEVAIGDLNGDGKPDVAVSNSTSVSVLLGDGSGGLTPVAGSPFATGGWAASSIAIGDLNGDSHPDIAISNPGTGPGSVQGLVRVLFGDGRGGFSPETGSPFASGESSEWVSIGDMNGDGRPDLAVAGGTSEGQVTVLLANPYVTSVPVAALTIAPNPVLAGQQVQLDASNSTDTVGTITDYRWDLGNGSFTEDTGATPTLSTSFAVAGSHQVRVEVTNDAGQSSIASATVTVTPAPPPGAVGVSINDGDYATNSPDVQLYVVWLPYASHALISNDGGFGSAGGTKTVPVAATIPWILRSQSGERLSKTVYVRFPDSADPLLTFTDDIVLDTTVPVVQDASNAGTGLAAKPAPRATSAVGAQRTYKVRINAREKRSGISRAQFSRVRHGGTIVYLRGRKVRGIMRLSRVVSVRMKSIPRYVRVRSAAGNWSKWHRIS